MASASAAQATKSAPRWETSRTDIPDPPQLVSSEAACSRTGRGSWAGPAEKLKTRTESSLPLMRAAAISSRLARRAPRIRKAA